MEKRIVLFLVLSFAVLVGHAALMRFIYGPPQQQAQEDVVEGEAEPGDDPLAEPGEEAMVAVEDADPEASDEESPSDEPADDDADELPADEDIAEEQPEEPARQVEQSFVTLGSADPTSPYRMMVVLTNTGASVRVIRLNGPRFRDLDYRGGYLGYILPVDDPLGRGIELEIVGPGTPAAKAGLREGDIITSLNGIPTLDSVAFLTALEGTRPGDEVPVTVLRDEQEETLSVTLGRKALDVVEPEAGAPPSFRLALARLDDARFETAPENDDEITEIPGADLLDVNWEIVHASRNEAVFRHVLRQSNIEVIKRFRLVQANGENADEDGPFFHLDLRIEIRNLDGSPHQVAYALDGPNGLPTEGWWYASKISRSWGGVGLRDIAVGLYDGKYVEDTLFSAQKVADGETFAPNPDMTLSYIGVDAQYFAAILIPQKDDPSEHWFADYRALRVAPPPKPEEKRLTNTTVRLISTPNNLEADGGALIHQYRVFSGPKRPELLAEYGLQDLVYYGWFGWVSRPMLSVLHFFHDYLTFGNYGLAIILLTVVVRCAMFPLSRKQALNAQKMQELQPELKRIAEKYKKDVEKRTKAQQDLFKKHNYNPLGGCLLMFFQLPIFIGLYRSLMVDVELRQAPLISESIRWCSNLAAPDMLLYWEPFMPGIVVNWLGPYLNVLPLVTVGLFLWQQKMFMPPATDEQTRMQQQVMKFMMLFMGFLFFKVASGLCLYFIASSVWGIAERKVLPKTTPPSSNGPQKKTEPKPSPFGTAKASSSGNGAGKSAPRKKKAKGRR